MVARPLRFLVFVISLVVLSDVVSRYHSVVKREAIQAYADSVLPTPSVVPGTSILGRASTNLGSWHAWTKFDLLQLQGIAIHLASSIKPTQWSTLIEDAQLGTKQDQQQFDAILSSDLSTPDEARLLELFSGQMAWNAEDFTLLHDSLHEITGFLTPAELKMAVDAKPMRVAGTR